MQQTDTQIAASHIPSTHPQRPMKTLLKSLLILSLAPWSLWSATIYIDFGTTLTNTTGWNNITAPAAKSNIALVDSTGAATSITLSYTAFGDTNPSSGTTSPTDAAASYPATATQDNFFAYAVASGSFLNPQASVSLTIKGLNANELYSFSYFASRTGVSDNRETQYALSNGTDTSTVSLNASNNTGSVVSSSWLSPDANGNLTLTLSPGANNNNSNKFYFISVLEINSKSAIPEPGTWITLSGMMALGLVIWIRRKTMLA